jgi:tRNA (guanine-N7-)-methyltransferase
VTHDGFAELLACVLISGGSFTLTTDVDWYAIEARDIFDRHAVFDAGPVEPCGVCAAETKYGRKWLSMGRSIYAFSAVKTGNIYPNSVQETREAGEMEISVDKRIKNLFESASELKGYVVDGRGYRVIFRDVFADGEKEALVRTISVDEGFEQHYYLKIAKTQNGLRVKTDSVGCPYKTPGVRASVKYAAQKLASE